MELTAEGSNYGTSRGTGRTACPKVAAFVLYGYEMADHRTQVSSRLMAAAPHRTYGHALRPYRTPIVWQMMENQSEPFTGTLFRRVGPTMAGTSPRALLPGPLVKFYRHTTPQI